MPAQERGEDESEQVWGQLWLALGLSLLKAGSGLVCLIENTFSSVKGKQVPGTLEKGHGEHPVLSIALEDSKNLSLVHALWYKSY